VSYEYITYQRIGHAGVVLLNRPENMNRMSVQMVAEVRQAFEEAERDLEVAAIVLGAEGRNYSAGADVGGFKARAEQQDPTAQAAALELRDRMFRSEDSWVPYILRIEKPTIAAVQGLCVGMGLTTILPFDFRIAAEDARFGMVFVNIGLIPELTSSALLPRMVGEARALDWCLSGRLVPAQEALAAGLVTRVVPNDELRSAAIELANQLASKSPPALMAIRRLLRNQPLERDIMQILRNEIDTLEVLYRSPEHRESVNAFLEKRTPNFRSLQHT